MSDTKTDEKRDAWHRHPALIAGIPAVTAVIGSVLTIVLGQAGALPSTINPAPAQATVSTTQTVTATATTTATATVTETPAIQPTTGTSNTPLPAAGELAITIVMGRGGRIGPDEYRSGSAPGANADVYDETGRLLDGGCYTTWVLKRGTAMIRTSRTGACRGGGFTMFNFGSDSLKTPGAYSLTVSALTDGGLKGTTTLAFKVT